MKINALIFAGGKGERMKAQSKPMVLLKKKPLISYGIDALLENGITDITIIRNVKDEKIFSLLDIYKNSNANITFLTDSFQKGVHFNYLYFEKQLHFPLISMDCDIYFNQIDFSKMLSEALSIFEKNTEVSSAVAVSLFNPFNEPQSIIIKENRVIDYIAAGDPAGYYGGYIYIWRNSPCKLIKSFYKHKEENQSFINFYAKYNLMIPMQIRCVWDNDTPKQIEESEKFLDSLEEEKRVYEIIIEELKKQKSIIAIALGGSRTRKYVDWNTDYDLFCLINDDDFENFREKFSGILNKIPNISLSVEAFYLEHFGYLFKALSSQNIQFDISILPVQRAKEMGIRSSNKVLYDPLDLYTNLKEIANDVLLSTEYLEKEKINDYIGLFHFEWLRFKKSYFNNDYWLALKAVEKMKIYYIHLYRIAFGYFANTPHCPEKQFDNVCKNELKSIYVIDGTFITLRKTAEALKELFEKSFNPIWAVIMDS